MHAAARRAACRERKQTRSTAILPPHGEHSAQKWPHSKHVSLPSTRAGERRDLRRVARATTPDGPIEAVLFDLDGTLCSSEHLSRE